MVTLTFPYNHARDPMNPQDLGDKINAALALGSIPAVDISPTQITVTHPAITAANTAAIQAVISAYVLTAGYVDSPGTPNANLALLLTKAANAIAANKTFQAIPSPTQAQALAQVQALTLQVNALIRVVANQLADTSGT